MKQLKKIPTPFLIIGIVILILIFIMFRIISAVSSNDSIAEANVRKMEQLDQDVSDVEAKLREEDTAAEVTTELSDEEAQQIEEYSSAELKQHYEGSVIMGDSITNSIVEYEFLGRDVVVSEIGLSVAKADDQIATAIELNPSKIIMCFGANDLETYVENSNKFISAYSKQIKKLKKALPKTKIYINGILPIEDSRLQKTPALQYYSAYNEKLKVMCDELNCTYIDSSFLLTNNPNYYEPDGEHLIYKFYPKWLTYMAIKAGL